MTCVIDFWTLSCVRCPAALTGISKKALEHKMSNIVFIAYLLGPADDAEDVIGDMWTELIHVHMSVDT
jgi:hypothetical protein